MNNKAIITGIGGQDGAYLAKHLLEKGYEIIGIARRSSVNNLLRLDVLGIRDKIEITYASNNSLIIHNVIPRVVCIFLNVLLRLF